LDHEYSCENTLSVYDGYSKYPYRGGSKGTPNNCIGEQKSNYPSEKD